MEWISVKDRLPEYQCCVLVFAGGLQYVGRHFGDEWRYWSPMAQGGVDVEPTHWMPLPQPPKGDSDER
jgi:hypothetical protein